MVNKCILVGNLGNDPEVRYTSNGKPVANFRLATNESWTDQQGQKQERTEWHRVVVWGKMGENCGEYLTKGRQVYLEGKLRTRSWEDRDGNKRFTTEIVADSVRFLGGQPRNTQASHQADVADTPSVSNDAQQLLLNADVPF